MATGMGFNGDADANDDIMSQNSMEQRLARMEQQLALQRQPQSLDMSALATAIATALRSTPNVASLPSPPTFSGDGDSLEWMTFIDLFEKNLELNGWIELSSVNRAQLLQSALRTHAANVFQTLTDLQKNDYDQAVAALTRVYVNPAKTTLYQNLFDERVQKKGETLETLVMDLKKLVKRAYPEIKDSKVINILVNRRFVEAIADEQLRDAVRMWRKDTVDLTLVEALRLESALRQQNSKHPRTIVSVNHVDVDNHNQQSERNVGYRGYGGSRGRSNGGQGQRSYGGSGGGRNGNGYMGQRNGGYMGQRDTTDSRTCYNCGEQGHIAKRCSKSLKD